MSNVDPLNLLLITSDQHRRSAAGCYGHSLAHTPNLDGLADRGVRFDAAYCNFPICVPSRASLATGRYAHELGVWDNAAPYTGQRPSWGHRLVERGHPVTTIGKLHFRRPDDDTGFPDQRIPMHVKEGVGDLYGSLRPDVPRQRNYLNTAANPSVGESEYMRYDAATTRQAIDWLATDAQRHTSPWCLWVSYTLPHSPFVASAEDIARYPLEDMELPINFRSADWPRHPHTDYIREQRIQSPDEELDETLVRRTIATYLAMCTYLDRQIGSVLEALNQLGLGSTTRVIYTSDHGEMLGDHGMWGKNLMYEGASAVPFLMAGPDIAPGRVVPQPVSLVDLFPTIVEGVGAPLADQDADLSGMSLWPAAHGDPLPDRTVFAEYHASGCREAMYMLRDGTHKYVHHVGDPPQLFDLSADPDETRDLATDPKSGLLLERFERHLRTVVDPEAVDRAAKADQARRVQAGGGLELISRRGPIAGGTPAPNQFREG
ncbi:MAG: sulfatase-like hydrolase/transferase [Chloroflexota bacterium]|nr:sulfatase-like hydrolase/transferase [Chloroflexota bacterium]